MAGMAKALKVGRIEAGPALGYGLFVIHMIRAFTAADTDRASAQVLKSQPLPGAVVTTLGGRAAQTPSLHR
jgi:hypothetical protein